MKKIISVTYLLFFSINSVEYLSALTSFRYIIGSSFFYFHLPVIFFIAVGHMTKHMMHDVHCATF